MPVAIDNFFQVPGLYVYCLAPCPSDEFFVSTHIDRIQLSPEFGKLKIVGKSRGWDILAMSTAISDKESSNDIFVTDQVTSQLVFVEFGAKFGMVRTTSLAKILSRADPDDASAVASSTSAQRGRVENTLDPFVASQVKLQAVTSSHLHHPRLVQQQQPQQPPSPSRTTPVDQTLPSLPSLNGTGPQTLSVEVDLREMLSKMTDVPADQFQGHVALDELGIDSLMVTEIVSEIHEVSTYRYRKIISRICRPLHLFVDT